MLNKQNYLLQQANRWREEGIISEQQWQTIVARYPETPSRSQLPVLAAILLGLGILTFIASNWNGISHAFRLVIIIVSLITAYGFGEYLHTRGYQKLGMSCTFIGVVIYGAGFFLIGQMFQLSANPVSAFYMWFLGAAALSWHYRSRFLTCTSLVILIFSGFYGLFNDYRDVWNITLFYLLFIVGISPLMWRFRSRLLTALSVVGLLAVFVGDNMVKWESLQLVNACFLALLGAGYLVECKREELGIVIKTIAYGAITMFSVLIIFFSGNFYDVVNVSNSLFFALTILMAAALFFFVQRKRHAWLLMDLIPFLPVPILYVKMVLVQGSRPYVYADVSVIALLAMLLFSIGMVAGGERLRDIWRINIGALLFALTCFVGYINFAWDFMDKSLFFLLGGGLLLILSILLERKRRKWVHEAKEGDIR